MSEILDKTRGIRKGEELDHERLGAYLRESLHQPDAILSIEQFPSGHSNLTYAVGLGDLDLVLRRPPFGSKVKSAHDMGREYRVLSKLHPHYSPAPKPLLYCEDESIIGAPFYVMQRIRGVIVRRDPPEGLQLDEKTARRLSESFIDNLAALHAIDYEAIGLADLGKPHGYIQRQVEGWIKRYAGSQTDELPEVEPLSRWLTEQMPVESGASLIHNDYKYDNVILDPVNITKIIGVLDWEMSTLGDPLMDLGTALCYWIDPDDPDDLQLIRWAPTTVPGTLNRRQLAERYAETSGRDVSNMLYYYVFSLFKTAVVAQQIYYRFKQGVTKDERFAFFIEATRIMFRAALRSVETGKY